MPITNRIQFVPMTSFDAAGLVDPNKWYPLMNPVPSQLSSITISNFSNRTILISYDGKTAHNILASNSSNTTTFQIEAALTTGIANLAKGSGVYIQGVVGIGSIYCSATTVHSS